MDNCILLVKMFAGGFNVENIGHEIIDYYLPDDGDEYHIFIPPYGNVNNQKKIGPILLLEKTSISYILRVVAVVKNHSVDDCNFDSVKYDGKPLTQILFSEEENEDGVNKFRLSTFKCKKTDYYKTRDLNLFIIPASKADGPFNKENRAALIEQFNEKYQGCTLIELKDKKPWHNISYVEGDMSDYQILNKKVLKKAKDNSKHDFANGTLDFLDYEQDNLLRYIDKEYDENAVTSFFYSLLNEKPDLAKAFVKYITKNKDLGENIKSKKQKLALTKKQILINRYINASKRKCKSLETHQKAIDKLKKEGRLSEAEKSIITNQNAMPFEKGIIDLFIETKDSLIVIENKIKSDLNGKNVNSDGEEISQLSKYDQYLSLVAGNKQRYLFVFAPDYNSDFLIDKNLSANFRKIEYSEIYSFFKERISSELSSGGVWNNKYLLFLNTLKKHSISLEDEMLIRFKNAIKN